MKELRTFKVQYGFVLSFLVMLTTVTGCVTVHTYWSYTTREKVVPFLEHSLWLSTANSGCYDDYEDSSNERYTCFEIVVIVDSNQEVDPSSDSVSVENMQLSKTAIGGPYDTLELRDCEQKRGPHLPPPCRSFWRFRVPKPRPDTLYLRFDVVRIDRATSKVLYKETFQRTAILEKENYNLWQAFGAFD